MKPLIEISVKCLGERTEVHENIKHLTKLARENRFQWCKRVDNHLESKPL